uniref:Uncharacterized protein n=1 Tax=Alexandrium monilatum TaxID=311494 RepID=A0A7S4RPQ2_9DINO
MAARHPRSWCSLHERQLPGSRVRCKVREDCPTAKGSVSAKVSGAGVAADGRRAEATARLRPCLGPAPRARLALPWRRRRTARARCLGWGRARRTQRVGCAAPPAAALPTWQRCSLW